MFPVPVTKDDFLVCIQYDSTKKAHIRKRTSDLEFNALLPHFENVNFFIIEYVFCK